MKGCSGRGVGGLPFSPPLQSRVCFSLPSPPRVSEGEGFVDGLRGQLLVTIFPGS